MVAQIPQDNPAQALVLAKQMTVLIYEGARKMCGDLSPVLVPPRYTFPPPHGLPFAYLVTCASLSTRPVVQRLNSALALTLQLLPSVVATCTQGLLAVWKPVQLVCTCKACTVSHVKHA